MPEETEGNPNWAKLLEILPEEFHALVKPELEGWDKGVQDKFTEFHEQYDPYKEFADNKVKPEIIEQALYLARQLEDDPKSLVEQAIKHFKLDGFDSEPSGNNDPDEDVDFGGDSNELSDLMKNPALKPFFDKQKEIEEWMNSEQQAVEDTTAEQELDEYLEQLHTDYDSDDFKFDNLFVTALMSQGVDADDAVEQFYNIVNQAGVEVPTASPDAPVVIGGAGTQGSGQSDDPVHLGKMKKHDVNDIVEQYLKNAQAG